MWVADVAHCYGSGVGRWLQLGLDPLAWKPPHAGEEALEKEKRKKKKRKKRKRKRKRKENKMGHRVSE